MAEALEHESGLLGLAGTADMRELLARDDPDARLALDVYVHRLRAGIARDGRRASAGSTRSCSPAAWGSAPPACASSPAPASPSWASARPGSPVRVLTVHAREDLEIARQARALLRAQGLEHL